MNNEDTPPNTTTTNYNLSDSNIYKVDEYFKCKDNISLLRQDLKDYKEQMNEYIELKELEKKTKELREQIKANETIQNIQEKIATERERMELLKELIRIEMLESAQTEITFKDRKLKLINIIKELPVNDKKNKKRKKN